MVFDKDKIRDMLNYFVQGRAESASIFVALTFGVFTILVLFDKAAIHSLAWMVLSIVYWALIFVIMFLFFGTTFNVVMINSLVREFYKDFDRDVPDILVKSRLAKWAFHHLFKDPDSSRLDILAGGFLILFPIAAGVLWYAIAFKQYTPIW